MDKTSEFLTSEKKEELYEWLAEKDSVSQKTLLGKIGLKVEDYHWNFPEEKTYPCGGNQTSDSEQAEESQSSESLPFPDF